MKKVKATIEVYMNVENWDKYSEEAEGCTKKQKLEILKNHLEDRQVLVNKLLLYQVKSVKEIK